MTSSSEHSAILGAEPGVAALVMRRRELFWQNVIREILSGLAAAAAMSAGRLSATPKGKAGGGAPAADLFDGRLAVITRLGQRIPIADITPMFACSIATGPLSDRALAADVQCTVYQITTPGGELYTIPVHEIMSFHTLSEQLIRRLQQAAAEAEAQGGTPGAGAAAGTSGRPFGFAAFTSLSRSEHGRVGGEESV